MATIRGSAMAMFLVFSAPLCSAVLQRRRRDDPIVSFGPQQETVEEQRPSWLASEDDRPLLFIGVNTAPANWKERMAIRQSWMRYECMKGPKPRVFARFIVGWNEPGSVGDKVMALESTTHNDFIRLPVNESYYNLVNKTIAYFHWFAQHGQAHFAMKIDDDVFPNLRKLVPILETKLQNHKTFTYAGDMLSHNKMLTWGKWAQDPAVYNETFYPVYAAGPAYVLQRDLIRRTFLDHYEEHLDLILSNEDANVGVWVHMENNTGTPVGYQILESEEEGCSPNVIFSMNLQDGKLACMWANVVANKSDICCGYEHSSWEERNSMQLKRDNAKATIAGDLNRASGTNASTIAADLTRIPGQIAVNETIQQPSAMM